VKTLKSLKITSIIQGLYCLLCFISLSLLLIGLYVGVNGFTPIGSFLLFYAAEFSIFVAPVCFILNLFNFIRELKYPEQRKLIGKKWIWIFVWPIITLPFSLLAVLPLIRVPIFS